MDIKQLAEKYELSQDDFWKHGISGRWIIKHDACEKIAVIEGIKFDSPNFIVSERDCCVIQGSAVKPSNDGATVERTEWTIGEADTGDKITTYVTSNSKSDSKSDGKPDNRFSSTEVTVSREGNCKMGYPYAIAEKRLKDRLTLKLINAYEYGIYSDSEADSFSKSANRKTTASREEKNQVATFEAQNKSNDYAMAKGR